MAISYAKGARVRSTHATSPVVEELDRRHGECEAGPLLDVALAQPAVRTIAAVDDLARRSLWGATAGEFTPPFRALHSTTLRSHRGGRTALDLYSTEPYAFGRDTTVLTDMFAVRAVSMLYGPDEDGGAGYDLAVEIISRRLRVGPGRAEQLLLACLHDHVGDPIAVAERLTGRINQADAPDRE